MPPKRHTKQRQAVLEVLRDTRSHPDAAWVFGEVRRAIPNVSLATVYRALDALSGEGVIGTIERAGERARYDYRRDHHHHAVCRNCGAIFDVPAVQVFPTALPNGFQIGEVVVEYHGTCQACAQKEAGDL